MNVILWHYKISSEVYIGERYFNDIIDFNYCTDFDCYKLTVFNLDESDEKAIPVSFPIGRFDNDYIYYNGIKFFTEDFPALVKMIYNRNIKETLKVLK